MFPSTAIYPKSAPIPSFNEKAEAAKPDSFLFAMESKRARFQEELSLLCSNVQLSEKEGSRFRKSVEDQFLQFSRCIRIYKDIEHSTIKERQLAYVKAISLPSAADLLSHARTGLRIAGTIGAGSRKAA